MAVALVEDLLPGLRPLVFKKSSASLEEVRSVMVTRGISRVPIVDGDGRTPRGIVRVRTLFRRGLLGIEPASLDDVMEDPPRSVPYSHDLDVAIERLRESDKLLIQNPHDGRHTHILTPRGLANWLHDYSRPFRVVEQLETALRDRLRPFEGTTLQELVSRREGSRPPPDRVEALAPRDYEACFVALTAQIT